MHTNIETCVPLLLMSLLSISTVANLLFPLRTLADPAICVGQCNRSVNNNRTLSNLCQYVWIGQIEWRVDWHRATDGFQYRGIHDRSALALLAFSVVARSRLVKIGKSNQFRLGVVNHCLRSSLSRPSVSGLKPLSPLFAHPFRARRFWLQTKNRP